MQHIMQDLICTEIIMLRSFHAHDRELFKWNHKNKVTFKFASIEPNIW